MFQDADPTTVMHFNAWEKSVNSDSGLSRTIDRLFRRAPNTARSALWGVFEACSDLYPFSRECSIQIVNLTDYFIGSKISVEYFMKLSQSDRQYILQHHSKLDRRLFSAYLMSLIIAGNPAPVFISKKYYKSVETPESESLRDYIGSKPFIETVNRFAGIKGYAGAENLFCLLRQIYGEDKIIQLLNRIVDEDFNITPRALLRLLHSWDEAKTQPFEWALEVMPNPLETKR